VTPGYTFRKIGLAAQAAHDAISHRMEVNDA
jgi:hypothetical protein